MKILLLSNYKLGIGGINAQVELLHTYLNQEDGMIADIFSTKGTPLHRCAAFFKLLCRANQYDVLHIHACSYRGTEPQHYPPRRTSGGMHLLKHHTFDSRR